MALFKHFISQHKKIYDINISGIPRYFILQKTILLRVMIVPEWNRFSWLQYHTPDTFSVQIFEIKQFTNKIFMLQVFYFMQPDTTPLKLARDIAAKLSGKNSDSQHPDEQPRNGDCQETEPAQRQADPETSRPGDSPGNQIQIIPLYTPEGSTIKFFCVHPSHRYAMSLVPMSTGFQGQVK